MDFVVGFVFAVVALVAVLYNQVKKHQELQAYVDQLEDKARAATDELWDDLSALKTKAATEIAELRGKIGK